MIIFTTQSQIFFTLNLEVFFVVAVLFFETVSYFEAQPDLDPPALAFPVLGL
jgi:hypothetical protein